MPECLLIKRQARGLQPYLKRDFDADFFPVNVEEFSKDLAEPIQHFIQRSKNAILHDILDRFNRTKKKKKRKKSGLMKKNRVR